MNVQRRLGALLLMVLLAPGLACTAQDEAIATTDLVALARRRVAQPWRFEATVVHGGSTLVVRGVVEDDLRRRAEVLIDGRAAWEEVTFDDRRYVRTVPEAFDVLLPPPVAGRILAVHPAFAELLSGRWVVEPDGAPPEVGGEGRPLHGPFGPAVVLDHVRSLEQIDALVDLGMSRWDPESTSYLRKNDRFPPHEGDGSRFDHVPPAYDPGATGVTLSAVRGPFEHVSLWARDDGLTRVERLVELPVPDDETYRNLYDQIRRAGSSRLQALVRGDDRTVRSTVTLSSAAGVRVEEPTGATEAEVTAALRALATQLGPAPPAPLYGPVE